MAEIVKTYQDFTKNISQELIDSNQQQSVIDDLKKHYEIEMRNKVEAAYQAGLAAGEEKKTQAEVSERVNEQRLLMTLLHKIESAILTLEDKIQVSIKDKVKALALMIVEPFIAHNMLDSNTLIKQVESVLSRLNTGQVIALHLNPVDVKTLAHCAENMTLNQSQLKWIEDNDVLPNEFKFSLDKGTLVYTLEQQLSRLTTAVKKMQLERVSNE